MLKEFIYDIIEREYPLESFNTKEEYISIIDELDDIKNEINDSLLYRVKLLILKNQKHQECFTSHTLKIISIN